MPMFRKKPVPVYRSASITSFDGCESEADDV